MGLRTLISALVRTAARYDKAARPIVSHVSRHYARTYLELESGAQVADDCIDELGYIDNCEDCLWRDPTHGLIADPVDTCPVCGSDRVLTAGPLWLGPVADPDFARAVRASASPTTWARRSARGNCLEPSRANSRHPHALRPAPTVQSVGRARHRDGRVRRPPAGAGYEASRAHYRGTAVKSTASIPEMRDAILGNEGDADGDAD